MPIEDFEEAGTPDYGEILESHEIAILAQGQKIVELEDKIKVLERAFRNHINNLTTAHKL